MLSLISFMLALGALGAVAVRYGADTRRDDGPKL
jgi:hypothetical protein